MSLLSYEELLALVARGVITNVDPEQVNAASIDLTLGPIVLGEVEGHHEIKLKDKPRLNMRPLDLYHGPIRMRPGSFILASTQQKFNLPNDISAEYKLKSSMARIGINHCLAGWCDAGWNGSVLTLELMNVTRHHTIELNLGDPIGQMIFFHHRKVPDDRSYAARGRYNGDTATQGAKE